MEAWDLAALRVEVKIRRPESAKRLTQIINSLGRSREIFEYHKRLTRDAFVSFSLQNDPEGMKFAEQLFGAEDPDGAIHEANLVSEANLIACMAATRNSFDSFGQLLNDLMLPKPLPSNPYIHQVKNAMPDGDLKARLHETLLSGWFAYTQAFMNIVKHQQLIVHNAGISFIDLSRGGKVEAFTYKGKGYPAYWVREVLEGVVELQNSLLACGVLLNRVYLGTAGGTPPMRS